MTSVRTIRQMQLPERIQHFKGCSNDRWVVLTEVSAGYCNLVGRSMAWILAQISLCKHPGATHRCRCSCAYLEVVVVVWRGFRPGKVTDLAVTLAVRRQDASRGIFILNETSRSQGLGALMYGDQVRLQGEARGRSTPRGRISRLFQQHIVDFAASVCRALCDWAGHRTQARECNLVVGSAPPLGMLDVLLSLPLGTMYGFQSTCVSTDWHLNTHTLTVTRPALLSTPGSLPVHVGIFVACLV